MIDRRAARAYLRTYTLASLFDQRAVDAGFDDPEWVSKRRKQRGVDGLGVHYWYIEDDGRIGKDTTS